MWIGLSEAFAVQQLEKLFGMPPAHIRIILAILRTEAEMTPTFDDLLGRAAADPQLQASAGYEIRRAGVLGHVVRILIPHIDHCCADFDFSRLRPNRSKQRKWGCKLLCEVMNTEVGSVHSHALGLDGKINGLQEHVSR
jgi:hypothetical protein